MKSALEKTILLLLLAFLVSTLNPPVVSYASLSDEIDKKNKELEEVNNQIKSVQKDLTTTNVKSASLEGEVKQLNSNIKQLNLGIRSAEISISKLSLELESLGDEIQDTEKSIADKNSSMADVLKEIQIQDNENTLIIFLKSKNLADGMNNIQSLLNLNEKLTLESQNLKNLHEELDVKIKNSTAKKEDLGLQNSNLKNRKYLVEDQTVARKDLLNLTKKQSKSYADELSDLKKRQESIASEIEDIERKIREGVNPNSIPTKGNILGFPLKGYSLSDTLSQEYGATKFAKYGYAGGFHNGIDLAIPLGTPLFSTSNGEIIAIGNQDNYCYRGAYGRFVVVKDNDNSFITLYGHLSKTLVAPGQKISRGQLIGYSGTTGYSTGPHLHLSVYLSSTFYMGPSKVCGPMPFGATVNPLDYLSSN